MQLIIDKAKYGLVLLGFGVFMFVSCDQNANSDVSNNEVVVDDSNSLESGVRVPSDTIVLMERSFSDGKFTAVMPFDWSDYTQDTIFRKSGKPFITTFKYKSATDSASAIGVSYGVDDNVPLQYLGKFVTNLEEEARTQANLRKIDKQFVKLEGERETGVITYSVWDGTNEIDLSVIAAAVVNKNILTLNIYFKGPVTPQQEDAARLMVRSFKVNLP